MWLILPKIWILCCPDSKIILKEKNVQIIKQQIVISIGCNCFLHTYAKVIINFSIYLVVYNSKCNHGAFSQC